MSDDESTSDGAPRHDVVKTAVGALHALLGSDPDDDAGSSGSTDSVQESGSSDEKSE